MISLPRGLVDKENSSRQANAQGMRTSNDSMLKRSYENINNESQAQVNFYTES
jgi:hypothetical protein